MNEKPIEIPLRKRPNYAHGMVLGVEDFQQEFSYFMDRLRFHNRELHGYGTVSGLEVSMPQEETESITLNAGVGIDRLGNEIFLPAAVRCPFPDKGDIVYLVLSWAERDTDFVPVKGSETEGDQMVPSRVEEYAVLNYDLEEDNPNSSGVVLAHLKKVRGQWKIDKKFPVRRASS
jgi:hypothetical protein